MTKQEWLDKYEASIYGACIAQQVYKYIKENGTAPDLEEYYRFHEEAEAVVETTIEATLDYHP